jgi:hypothetical protein
MRTIFTSLIALLIMLPGVALAANLSVYPESVVLKKGDAVGFIVHLQSKTLVNTIGSEIVLPPNTTFLSATGGNVVSQWIELPTYSAGTKSLSFSGLMLNGWHGDGTVTVIKIAAKEDGVYSLTFNKEATELYKNDGKGTPEPVVYGIAAIPLLQPQGMAIIGLILLIAVFVGVWLHRKYKITFV